MKNQSKWVGRTLFVLALGLAGPVWADGPVDEAGALVFYEKGIALEAEGKWAKAEEQFVESLKRHERPRTAAHLGRVQVEQGKFVEGATNMEWFFREDTEVPLEKKELGRQPLVVALSNVGTLKLNIEPLDAVITIDGRVVPTNRRSWPQYVMPKVPHTVEVKKEGFVTKSETWTLGAGTEKLVKITLEPARVDAASGKGKVVGPVKPGGGTTIYPGWFVGGGLTLLGAGALVGGMGLYSVTDPDYQRLNGLIKSGSCDKQCGADVDEYNGDNTLTRALAYTGTAVGTAGLIVLAYSAITTRGKLAPRREASNSLRVLPSFGGFVVTGQM